MSEANLARYQIWLATMKLIIRFADQGQDPFLCFPGFYQATLSYDRMYYGDNVPLTDDTRLYVRGPFEAIYLVEPTKRAWRYCAFNFDEHLTRGSRVFYIVGEERASSAFNRSLRSVYERIGLTVRVIYLQGPRMAVLNDLPLGTLKYDELQQMKVLEILRLSDPSGDPGFGRRRPVVPLCP